MDEKLIRQELPIQSIYSRGQDCTATVPIHLKILDLPVEIRNNPGLVRDAEDIVSKWYNEDMNYYLEALNADSVNLPWLKGYEVFRNDWTLDGEPDESGFLKLGWNEGGDSHLIRRVGLPVVLFNEWNGSGNFISFKDYVKKGWIEVAYRDSNDPEFVCMSPEKMLKYGKKSDMTTFDMESGLVEVIGNAFCSDYHENMARALLLRDFAVFYLNKLLCITEKSSSN